VHTLGSCATVPELQTASWKFERRGEIVASIPNFLEGKRLSSPSLLCLAWLGRAVGVENGQLFRQVVLR
jgi:hypothetical protein